MIHSLPSRLLGSYAFALVVAVGGCANDGDEALSIVPNAAPAVGGTPVMIRGSGFRGHGPVAVYLGGAPAKGIVIHSDVLITAVSPKLEEAGTVDLNLVFGDGQTQAAADAFLVQDASQPVVFTTPEAE